MLSVQQPFFFLQVEQHRKRLDKQQIVFSYKLAKHLTSSKKNYIFSVLIFQDICFNFFLQYSVTFLHWRSTILLSRKVFLIMYNKKKLMILTRQKYQQALVVDSSVIVLAYQVILPIQYSGFFFADLYAIKQLTCSSFTGKLFLQYHVFCMERVNQFILCINSHTYIHSTFNMPRGYSIVF